MSTNYSSVTDGKKQCSKCNSWLPVGSFRRSSQAKCGYRAECKACSWKDEQRRRADRKAGIAGVTGRPRKMPVDGKLECTICKQVLPVENFGPHALTASGLESRCKKCNVDRVTATIASSSKAFLQSSACAHKDNLNKSNSKRRTAFYADSCVCTQVLCDLWKEQDGKCAVTGLPMTHIRGKGFVTTNASIDRIDNTAGYTRDNIRLVCRQVNVMKGQLSDDELMKWCHRVIKVRG